MAVVSFSMALYPSGRGMEACPQRALGFGIYDDIADHPLMVERVATMPDPVITQPNYAIEPCEAALRAADAAALQNLGEI